jgi:ABC-type antimicrobial peptide transport system permease subunit
LKTAIQSIYDRFANNQKWAGKDHREEAELQPLSDVHFNSKYAGGGEWVKAINTSWLWFFGSVGLAVLVLACINFVNLSTAQALSRAKEIGIRKSVGAGRFQLIFQFLSEAFVLITFAAVLAVIIAKLSLPYINDLSEKQIRFDILRSPLLLISLVIGICFTSLMAGTLPCIYHYEVSSCHDFKNGVSKLDAAIIVAEKRIGSNSIQYICLPADRSPAYREANELYAAQRSWL